MPTCIWKRLTASLVDLALVASVAIPAVLATIWLMEAFHEDFRMSARHARYLSGIFTVAIWVIGFWLYEAFSTSSEYRATLGKHLLGLSVVGLHDEQISFPQATARHFAKFLSTFLLFFGFIMAAFGSRRQGLHDVIAATVVVERK